MNMNKINHKLQFLGFKHTRKTFKKITRTTIKICYRLTVVVIVDDNPTVTSLLSPSLDLFIEEQVKEKSGLIYVEKHRRRRKKG